MRTTLSQLAPLCACVCVSSCVSASHSHNVELVNTFQTKPRGGECVRAASSSEPRRYAPTHNLGINYNMTIATAETTTTPVTTTGAGCSSIFIQVLWANLHFKRHILDKPQDYYQPLGCNLDTTLLNRYTKLHKEIYTLTTSFSKSLSMLTDTKHCRIIFIQVRHKSNLL